MSETTGFWNIARESPERLAVVDPTGREVTYGELAALANRVSHGVRALGVVAGGNVAITMPNSIEYLAVYYGVTQIGLYLTPINWHLVGPEIAYIVEDSEAEVLIGHEAIAQALQDAAKEISLPADQRFAIGTVPGYRAFGELVAGQPETEPDDRSSGAPMHYTSGTTGKPKGVRRKLMGGNPDGGGGAFLLDLYGVKPYDDNVHICGSPLYHTAVLAHAAMGLTYGHPVILMDRWTPEGMLELIDRHKVTWSHMVPTQFHRLLALPDEVKSKYDVASLRRMVHAAAPCPEDVKRKMIEWWGTSITEYYAATEGGGTLIHAEDWLEHPGSVGRPWPMAEIVIFDEEGNQLPEGQVGTVYMRMGGQPPSFEYFKDADKTEQNRQAGFFTVGDIGVIEDGYLYLRDRKSDMIISGGVNIYPAEIESVLLGHPKVGDAAVFGIPHDDWGEEVKAVVEPAAGVEPSEELVGELMAHCREQLARFKLPKSIDFTTEMPRDPNGKLYKRKLKAPYWEGRTSAI